MYIVIHYGTNQLRRNLIALFIPHRTHVILPSADGGQMRKVQVHRKAVEYVSLQVSTPTCQIQARDRPIDPAHHRRVAAGWDGLG
jgi:hypothetical protein